MSLPENYPSPSKTPNIISSPSLSSEDLREIEQMMREVIVDLDYCPNESDIIAIQALYHRNNPSVN